MAITFTQEPTGIYPAYNDSYITFSNVQVGVTTRYARITAEPFDNYFTIYPDTNGIFTFNLKEIVKANFDGFEDSTFIPPSAQYEIKDDRILDLDVNIWLDNGSTITVEDKTYTFSKSVKQIDETIFENNCQLLHKSTNGIDYNLTYFEGYEFQFELLKVSGNTDIKIVNLNSTNEEVIITGNTDSNTMRLWVDKGTSNWTTLNVIALTDNVNRLEIYEDDVFKTNLNLKKVPSKCGVYLKWFNPQGGYSYWLFDEYYRETLKGKAIGEITRNSFLNVDESPKSFSYNQGKEITKTLRLKSTMNNDEINYVKEILTSPSVQLYTSQTPFQTGEWITVNVSGTVNTNNRRINGNDITLTVELPVQYNITY
ncbi:hypothetical protein [Psychroserpens mesophilus]|uniref:hypothetical protein n=1 Tax=Psychroserpens mesophilus TaxID=325473 RepID=UPI003D65700E